MIDESFIDPYSNIFIEDGREYCTMRNSTGTAGDTSLTNFSKAAWYISLEPLPQVIKDMPEVEEDLVYCAATVALWKAVEQELFRKLRVYYEGIGRKDQLYDSVYFTAFVPTATMC